MEFLWTKIDIDSCATHFNYRLDYYTAAADGGVVLFFENDVMPVWADVVIGADGIDSRVRAIMFKGQPTHVNSKFSGVSGHRGVISQYDTSRLCRRNAALCGYSIVS